MKLTLKKVTRKNTDKLGNPLVGRFGPYTKIFITAEEFGEKLISGFSKPWNASWNDGDVVEAEVEPNGEYLNLKESDPIKALEKRVLALERAIFTEKTTKVEEKLEENVDWLS